MWHVIEKLVDKLESGQLFIITMTGIVAFAFNYSFLNKIKDFMRKKNDE